MALAFISYLDRACPRDMAGPAVESSVERERAVAQILESMALGVPRRQGKTPIRAVQGLNRALLIDRKHHRMLGWIQVHAVSR